MGVSCVAAAMDVVGTNESGLLLFAACIDVGLGADDRVDGRSPRTGGIAMGDGVTAADGNFATGV